MEALVVYYSRTGNTKKVAEAIAKGLNCSVKSLEEAKDVSGYNLICVGTPVKWFKPVREMMGFLKQSDIKDKKVAVFCSYNFCANKRTLRIIKEMLSKRGAEVVGEFSTIGEGWGLRKGRPNKNDLKSAEEFGNSLKSKFA